jgi:hypothetical protein
MEGLREVLITVSNFKTNDIYLSRSYPDDDKDNNGLVEVYKTPVYKVFIEGTDAKGKSIKKEWTALRFMPFWNDPTLPSGKYKKLGFINAGLSSFPKTAVSYYNPYYEVHNSHSDFFGSIQIKGNFLIHAGPEYLHKSTWGGAGCVEIIGNFDLFKQDIRILGNSILVNNHQAILELVRKRNLFVKIDYATSPNFKKAVVGEY